VRTWFGNEEPVVKREQKYIECKEDLVTLRNGRECAGFDGFVEGVVRWLNCRFIRVNYVLIPGCFGNANLC
jgi:polyphosphate kinase 2 (PPK2 family)